MGAVLAVVGLVVLALSASRYGTTRAVVGCVVFGSALVLLYASSTLYHSVGHGHARAKAVLRVLDHSAIFLLIAGTYTPFTLVSLWGPWGWTLFGVVWGLALAGITLRLVLPRRPTALFVSLYLAMGWCVVVAAKPLLAAVAPGGIALLVAGRARVLRGRRLLRLAAPVPPRDLARLRAGRQRLPLRRRAALRRPRLRRADRGVGRGGGMLRAPRGQALRFD